LEQKYWYKIVERDAKGLKSLFHGNKGTRKLKTNKWMEAEIKYVKDGTSKTKYLSGWHIAPTYAECKQYLTYFKNMKNKDIVKCQAKVIWPKSHSRHNIFLAKWIKILEDRL
jgi:hypothetical protein